MAEPYFNPFDPAFRADPYPHYKPLVAGPPRLINLPFPIKIALAARYSDVVTILRDPGAIRSSSNACAPNPSLSTARSTRSCATTARCRPPLVLLMRRSASGAWRCPR